MKSSSLFPPVQLVEVNGEKFFVCQHSALRMKHRFGLFTQNCKRIQGCFLDPCCALAFLQAKWDRGIITDPEFKGLKERIKKQIQLKGGMDLSTAPFPSEIISTPDKMQACYSIVLLNMEISVATGFQDVDDYLKETEERRSASSQKSSNKRARTLELYSVKIFDPDGRVTTLPNKNEWPKIYELLKNVYPEQKELHCLLASDGLIFFSKEKTGTLSSREISTEIDRLVNFSADGPVVKCAILF